MEVLRTERLTLRRFEFNDAQTVQQLAGDYDIAKTTLNVPHPYPEGAAESWIQAMHDAEEQGRQYGFAVTLSNHELIGSIGIGIQSAHYRAEIAYWIGKPYWGQGFATEGAWKVVEFGFEQLNLHRMYGYAFANNPSSSRVLRKLGMQHEGTQRHHVNKWGEFIDLECYGLLRNDFAG
jgi:[ribosomal protein S5]-alanine N-acetyltransferase